MPPLDDVHLYVILDVPLIERLGRDAADIMQKAFAGGARMFQLRHKGVSEGKLCEEAQQLMTIARRLGAPFIVNDSLAVALAVSADGVHLGEDDLPVDAARKIAGQDFIIGASASSVQCAIEAERNGADYIGYGAMFATGTKDDANPGTLEELQNIMSAVKVPVFPLGGINENNVHEIVNAGCNRACVASGVVTADDPERAANRIAAALSDPSMKELP